MSNTLLLQTLPNIPDVKPGDNLAHLLADSLRALPQPPTEGDTLAVAQKVVSKAEGRYVNLNEITPTSPALELAKKLNKDARKIQVILDESRDIVRATAPRPNSDEGILITEHRLGFICANAAVDESNIDQKDSVLLLPTDPDASAKKLRESLHNLVGIHLGIVITDTFGRPWRRGLVDFAIGIAGIPVIVDLAGTMDAYGRELHVTMPAVSDAIAAAAGMLMAKAGKCPAVLLQGLSLPVDITSTARDILRTKSEDLFR